VSRKRDWEKAKQRDRARPVYGHSPIKPSPGMGSPATPKQLAYLRRLDPTLSEESVLLLDRWGASRAIEHLECLRLATPRQLAYLSSLDPAIPEERLATLSRNEASLVISRLLGKGPSQVKPVPKRTPVPR